MRSVKVPQWKQVALIYPRKGQGGKGDKKRGKGEGREGIKKGYHVITTRNAFGEGTTVKARLRRGLDIPKALAIILQQR